MSQILHTGAVTAQDENGGSPGFSGSGPVGSAPQIDDNSDSSYLGLAFGTAQQGNGTSANDLGFANLDQLTIDPATVTDFTCALRISATEVGVPDTPNSAGIQFEIDIPGFTATGALAGFTLISAFSGIVPDGTTVDLTFSLLAMLTGIVGADLAADYIAQLAAYLATGSQQAKYAISGSYVISSDGTSHDVVKGRAYFVQISAVSDAVVDAGHGEFPAHHGVTSTRFVATTGSETSALLSGPTGDMPHADVHLGGFAITDANDPRTLAMDFQITSHTPAWVRVFAQWYTNVGGNLVAASIDALTERIPYGDPDTSKYLWTPVSIFHAVTAQATHWKPKFVFYSDEVANTPLPTGTEVFIDCVYIPDNCRSLAGLPYLDGDQSYGIWEGEPRRSPSIYGSHPPTDIVSPETIVLTS